MSLTPKQIRELVVEYLRVLYPKSGDVEITYLVKDTTTDSWKVNVRFKRDMADFFTFIAMLAMDSQGDITQFKEGWHWT